MKQQLSRLKTYTIVAAKPGHISLHQTMFPKYMLFLFILGSPTQKIATSDHRYGRPNEMEILPQQNNNKEAEVESSTQYPVYDHTTGKSLQD